MKSGSVTIEGASAPPSSIGRGLVVFLGVEKGDSEEDARSLADKIVKLRIFPDDKDRFNYSVEDVKGELLAVSQFTLCASVAGGRRPDFIKAEAPAVARAVYEKSVEFLRSSGLKVATGEFGARMLVRIDNDGPVTILMDTRVK